MAAHVDQFLLQPVQSSDDAERVIAYLITRGYNSADIVAIYRGESDVYAPELVAYFNSEQALIEKLNSIGLRLNKGTFWAAPSGEKYNRVFSELTNLAFTDGDKFDDIETMLSMFDRIIWTRDLWRVGPDYWNNTLKFWLESVDEQKGIFLNASQIEQLTAHVQTYVSNCWMDGREPFQTEQEYHNVILVNWPLFVPGQLQAVVEQAIDSMTNQYVMAYINWYTNTRPTYANTKALAGYIEKYGDKPLAVNKIIEEICGRTWSLVPSGGKWAITSSENVMPGFANDAGPDLLFRPASIKASGDAHNYLATQKIFHGWKVSPATYLRAQSARFELPDGEITNAPVREWAGTAGPGTAEYWPAMSRGPKAANVGIIDFSLPLAMSYYKHAKNALNNDYNLVRAFELEGSAVCWQYLVAEHYGRKINNRPTANYANRAGDVNAPTGTGQVIQDNTKQYAGDIEPAGFFGGAKPLFEARLFGNYPHIYPKLLKTAYYLCRYPQLQVVEMPDFTEETNLLADKFWREVFIGEDNCFIYLDKIIEVGERFANSQINANDFADEADDDTIEITYKSFSDAPGLGFFSRIWREIKRFGRRIAAEFKRIVKKIETALSDFLRVVFAVVYYTIMAVVAVVAFVVVALPAAVLALHAAYTVVLQVIAALYWAIYAAWQMVVAAVAYIWEQVLTVLAVRIVDFVASEFIEVPEIEVPEPDPWAPPKEGISGYMLPAALALAGGFMFLQ